MSGTFDGPTFEGSAVRLEWAERAIALITLTRPAQMNTLSLELLSEFDHALDLVDMESTRALIITGQERAFCCGAHLRYFAGPEASIHQPFDARDHYLADIAVLFDRLEELHFPTIAAINGFALGGGCELALSCDFRVIASHAKIGLPETKLGAVAGAGGVQKLIRHVGRSKALDWILRATHLDAATADRYGLVSAVVPGDMLLQSALDIALEIRKLGPRSVAQSKRSIYVSEDADLRTARRFGIEALSMLVGGDEWKEGMQAFSEKRAPTFDSW
ncbi:MULTISPECIES: enoyl-CoA hydratase/isomerase family protein [Paraburkholderia]|uniref:Enoyl-CoA hydratase/carnithine racemase n=1 Tax=Paraburkholderia dioscoreae TaxID=2604047 RepID=A0A5Q4YT03_9BURK|nr:MULTISPECIES: enoyl-CoA hydratase-related protein [Paraburkholderia]MDR8398139.1 enoyl-CoA hydratase-related protein [Paraburkholderia sp. USG1]VVD28205.1 Enoyl-CoA hydratase/carnithine racemase [Paraburkholderia dioscoreae]